MKDCALSILMSIDKIMVAHELNGSVISEGDDDEVCGLRR